MTRRHRGFALVELLVALPLAALAGAVLMALLVEGWHVARRQQARDGALRELRHALGTLAIELRPLAPSAVWAWSDTLLEFAGVVGAGIVCAPPSATRVVVASGSDAATARPWRAEPAPGDLVEGWHLGPDGGTPREMAATLAAVAAGRCALAGLEGRRAWELALAPPGWAGAVPGLPLRVTRRVRYRHYQGTGGWYLGRQAQGVTGWEVVQPVAGPLLAPTQGGLQVAAWDDSGRSLPGGAPGVRHLQVTLRAPAAAIGSATVPPPVALGAGITLRGGRP